MSLPKKNDFDSKDILAMTIAIFELLLPPVFIMFGAVTAIYFLLKLFI
ncbi:MULTISPECIES: hypothetical protein [Tepidanaerobacter]|uniref:Uncharacterized protein n=1 Tax=Tepidanaerobacter syntrophicus TaxID=224999 RepID=A0A0U9HP88_9FIRM|nr:MULTISPECIES: hypothetical protein [Tepidanaerobacter]GAQ25935.1 hypothetical protein TSYNT_9186 [Tepidanaerobacter syntrophicus]GLI19338.1 hypothetical protein TSYNTROPHJE_11510 [Tepidanaerobacter syntrophicus]GLI50447.1 hypothetical protein TSYNTROOL_05330 [Tepidanaerobacter syntrophicus]HHV82978.1 hypothetical protein [Tepidanaerobacter syntrophicus]